MQHAADAGYEPRKKRPVHCREITIIDNIGGKNVLEFNNLLKTKTARHSSLLAAPFSNNYLDDEAARHGFGSNGTNGGAACSPSPSPVFVDDDSLDSGYGGSCHGKWEDMEHSSSTTAEICRRKSVAFMRHKSFSTLQVCREEQEEQMMVDEEQQLNKENFFRPIEKVLDDLETDDDCCLREDSPFTSLKFGPIIKKPPQTTCKLKDKSNFILNRKQIKSESRSTLNVPQQFPVLCSITNSASVLSRCRSQSEIDVLQAMQKAEENRSLIGDFSDGHVLPLLKNPKVADLKCVSARTVFDILQDRYAEKIGHYALIDCRYPYEFIGGHIRSAVNIYTQAHLKKFLDHDTVIRQQEEQQSSCHEFKTRNVLLFYCEFSKERGPKMCRFLRAVDRRQNEYRYPCLDYPEIYLIEGGYKNFYASFKHMCEPQSYKPMDHEDHADDLRKFRLKSKSWSSFGGSVAASSVVNAAAPKSSLSINRTTSSCHFFSPPSSSIVLNNNKKTTDDAEPMTIDDDSATPPLNAPTMMTKLTSSISPLANENSETPQKSFVRRGLFRRGGD